MSEDDSNNCLNYWTSHIVIYVSNGIRKQWDKRLQFTFFKKTQKHKQNQANKQTYIGKLVVSQY